MERFLTSLVVVLALVAAFMACDQSPQATDEDLTADSLALVAFYNATDSPNWGANTNWLTGPVPTWIGVEVNDDRVTALVLSHGEISGEIHAALGNLTRLESLNLHSNEFTGTIPTELTTLSNLRLLHLYDNQLSGTLPPELGTLSNLESLQLLINQLTGAIPPELGDLANLQHLWLSDNRPYTE